MARPPVALKNPSNENRILGRKTRLPENDLPLFRLARISGPALLLLTFSATVQAQLDRTGRKANSSLRHG